MSSIERSLGQRGSVLHADGGERHERVDRVQRAVRAAAEVARAAGVAELEAGRGGATTSPAFTQSRICQRRSSAFG